VNANQIKEKILVKFLYQNFTILAKNVKDNNCDDNKIILNNAIIQTSFVFLNKNIFKKICETKVHALNKILDTNNFLVFKLSIQFFINLNLILPQILQNLTRLIFI